MQSVNEHKITACLSSFISWKVWLCDTYFLYFLSTQGAQKIQKLEDRLTKEWKGINASHVAGYRYLCCDHTNKTAKASPPSKVATLSKVFDLNQVVRIF
jgi:hypothetical protein